MHILNWLLSSPFENYVFVTDFLLHGKAEYILQAKGSISHQLAASPRTWTWLHTALLPTHLHYLLPLHPHDRLATVWPIFAKSLVAVGCWNAFWLSILISSSHNPELLSVLYCCTNSCYTVFLCYHPFRWLLVLSEPVYSTIATHIVTCALHERILGLCNDLYNLKIVLGHCRILRLFIQSQNCCML